MRPVAVNRCVSHRDVLRGRPGFTLMEVVVASASAAVLAVGMMSCLLIAGRALNEDWVAPARELKGGAPLEMVLSDTRHAVSFSERTAQAVTFQVPDRTGDTLPETIRYSWSGTAGDPLLMKYNAGTAATLAAGVYDFGLAYHVRAVTGTGFAQGIIYDEPIQVAFHDDAAGGAFSSIGVTASQWPALYFVPSLPGGTTTWDLTRVRLRMRTSSPVSGYAAVQIRPALTGPLRPSGTVLQEIVIPESTLTSSFDWYDFDYTAVNDLPAGQGLFVVVKRGVSGGTVALVQYEISIPDEPGMAVYRTQDTGATWQLLTGEMRFFIYGIAND
jgi:hypothetical protein